ncbi:ribonuclease H2 subunit B [Bicyclus anynana]|uniref:Ribonuclease H2 subunit B n=1 Tax=Bicyclus anynana TaxID=110368 RepID=A0A6J1PB80_BICAN|nr:ribonuclease H2 subunit B [Bicyclus anynana]
MGTRSKKKALISDTKDSIIRKRVENSWILFIKESLLDNDNFRIVTLPHPAHGNPAKYVLDNLHHKMYEVVTFSEPYRSWFIDDTVKSDGSVMMVTPFNPLFLVLPRLREQCANRAIPLEDLLSEKGFDKILDFIPNLDAVADLKGPQDIKAYKYNEEKTLNWLENKIRKLAVVLREKNVHVTSGAVSATFVSSNVNNENIDDEFYLRYAHGMISDYIEQDIADLLEKKFDFKAEQIEYVGNKRKSDAEAEAVNKRVKLDLTLNEESENIKLNLNNTTTEIKKEKPLTAKEKARQKAASKTKTISSFFCKK